jgi:hypothetical protein
MKFVAYTNHGFAVGLGDYSDMYEAEGAAIDKGIDYWSIFDEHAIYAMLNELEDLENDR